MKVIAHDCATVLVQQKAASLVMCPLPDILDVGKQAALSTTKLSIEMIE